MSYTIVGVTGHIDHGKSTLVRVLTGVDTDSHPEEKRRGITIDLGFAAFTAGEHRFALIDAPGHQKYIGNLLAGVSAIDIGLLVVACDQGIQRQTLEHAAVVKALGVGRLIVAISRIDLASGKLVAELTEELQLFLSEFGFDNVPVVPLSSVTGVGIESLKELMCDYARSASAGREDRGGSALSFRLPIDRVFVAPGRGVVVAGTVWSGEVRVGDQLEVAGSGEILRVRELEVHGHAVASSSSGYRTAINLAGAGHAQLRRGDELVAIGSHRQSDRLVVAVDMFKDTAEIRCPAVVQMHSGTQSCSARMLGVKRLQPSRQAIVLVEPEHALVATYGQACLFRRPYPVGAFAGGRILAAICSDSLPASANRTRNLIELGERLLPAQPVERLAAWVDFLGELKPSSDWCASQLGIPPEQYQTTMDSLLEKQSAFRLGECFVSVTAAERAKAFIRKLVTERTQSADDAWVIESSIFERARSVGSIKLVAWAIDALVRDRALVRSNHLIAIASELTTLSKKQRENMEQIVKLFFGTRSPPTDKEVSQQLKMNVDATSSLLRFITQQRIVIDVGQGLHISTQVFGVMCRELQSLFADQPAVSVATIRDAWQVTRKYAIPLLEYCDRQEVTLRRGNERVAGPALADLLNEAEREQLQ